MGIDKFSRELRSVFRPPHQQARTILPRPYSQPAPRDLENLFGDAAPQEETTTRPASETLQLDIATETSGPSATHQHQSPLLTPSPTNTPSKDDDLGHMYQNLPRDAKIGIIVGIIALVFLTLLGCGLCFLDCRRRTRKRKERKESHDTQLVTLEMEMRNEQTAAKRPTRKGLWDHLKPVNGSKEAVHSNTPIDDTHNITRRDSISTTTNDTATKWPTSHLTRDRASTVSSVPSTISSAGVPALPRSFIDGGAQR